MLRYVVMGLAVLWIAGCAGPGGPKHIATAGKNLKGQVVNSQYIAPDRSFTVALPYAEKSAEWQYMKVIEGHDDDALTYVEFGPVQGPVIGPRVFDNNLYSATFVHYPDNYHTDLLPIWAQRVFDNQIRAISDSDNAELQKVTFEKTWVNGQPAIYAVYAVDSVDLRDIALAGATRHYLVFCLINYDSGAANLMARVDPTQAYRIEHELRAGKWERFNRMALSFRPNSQAGNQTR